MATLHSVCPENSGFNVSTSWFTTLWLLCQPTLKNFPDITITLDKAINMFVKLWWFSCDVCVVDCRVNQPSGETSTQQQLLVQTCTSLEAEVRLITDKSRQEDQIFPCTGTGGCSWLGMPLISGMIEKKKPKKTKKKKKPGSSLYSSHWHEGLSGREGNPSPPNNCSASPGA